MVFGLALWGKDVGVEGSDEDENAVVAVLEEFDEAAEGRPLDGGVQIDPGEVLLSRAALVPGDGFIVRLVGGRGQLESDLGSGAGVRIVEGPAGQAAAVEVGGQEVAGPA